MHIRRVKNKDDEKDVSNHENRKQRALQHRIKMRNDTFKFEKWIEPLTEATVYPDTIWQERERNGEINKKKS